MLKGVNKKQSTSGGVVLLKKRFSNDDMLGLGRIRTGASLRIELTPTSEEVIQQVENELQPVLEEIMKESDQEKANSELSIDWSGNDIESLPLNSPLNPAMPDLKTEPVSDQISIVKMEDDIKSALFHDSLLEMLIDSDLHPRTSSEDALRTRLVTLLKVDAQEDVKKKSPSNKLVMKHVEAARYVKRHADLKTETESFNPEMNSFDAIMPVVGIQEDVVEAAVTVEMLNEASRIEKYDLEEYDLEESNIEESIHDEIKVREMPDEEVLVEDSESEETPFEEMTPEIIIIEEEKEVKAEEAFEEAEETPFQDTLNDVNISDEISEEIAVEAPEKTPGNNHTTNNLRTKLESLFFEPGNSPSTSSQNWIPESIKVSPAIQTIEEKFSKPEISQMRPSLDEVDFQQHLIKILNENYKSDDVISPENLKLKLIEILNEEYADVDELDEDQEDELDETMGTYASNASEEGHTSNGLNESELIKKLDINFVGDETIDLKVPIFAEEQAEEQADDHAEDQTDAKFANYKEPSSTWASDASRNERWSGVNIGSISASSDHDSRNHSDDLPEEDHHENLHQNRQDKGETRSDDRFIALDELSFVFDTMKEQMDYLKKQLDIKDHQLQNKDELIRNFQILLKNEQDKFLRLEHKMEEVVTHVEERTTKKGFFSRFGKR